MPTPAPSARRRPLKSARSLAGWSAFLPVLAVVCAGCGRNGGVPLAPVTGRVTFYGRPVEAEIVFQPETVDLFQTAGRPSMAISDAKGNYVLSFTEKQRGATIGPHRVMIKVLPYLDSGEPPTFKDATTPLKRIQLLRTVREGKNRFDFALSY